MTVLEKMIELCSTHKKVEKGDNSKSINARVMHLKYDTSPIKLCP